MIPKKTGSNGVSGNTAKGGAFVASPKGTKPSHVLKFKEGVDGKFTRITGLFEAVTKDGEKYLKGTDKENNITYVIMPNTYEAK